jgi:hypothetical protein
MQLLLISTNDKLDLIASSIRNVCNATLSLLFTTALFIWGVFVNRQQAWRIEGGTGVFGGSALALATIGTGLNFLYVPREDDYLWLPGLIWGIVLWQSFLGWWWWVGAGSGSPGFGGKTPVEEMISQMERRERKKREREERRKETREKARLAWQGVAGAFVKNRKFAPSERDAGSPPPSSSLPHRPANPFHSGPMSPPATVDSDGQYPGLLPSIVYKWYRIFRQAHQVAAQEQTVEQAERMREIKSISWWGPLRRWRLQNVTVYS